jgi:hypothetical protein
VNAFAFERLQAVELVLINKTNEPVRCTLPSGVSASSCLRLGAPTIDAKAGVQLNSLHDRYRSFAIAAPYTATAFHIKGLQIQKNTESR